MAQHNAASMADDENTPPQDPFATPLTINEFDDEAENPDEWEYEYSTTEKDTYYVTLDLTTPDIAPKTRTKHSAGGGPTKAKWLNPSITRVKRKGAADRLEGKGSLVRKGIQLLASQAETPRPGADIDDDAPESLDGTISHSQGRGEEEGAEMAKVQIMGLHTKNPIVSYHGHVYSCTWAQNIGTELLFTAHDSDISVPVLRELPGDVDLLAATSLRIISQSVQLQPKPVAKTQPKQKTGMDKHGKDPALSIPTGHTASEGRKAQARFLEKLMQVKDMKGEEDDVTVYTSPRLSRNGWKKHLEEKMEGERKRLKKIVKAKKPKIKVDEAKIRLQELEAEEERMREVERKWLAESRPQGRGRTRVLGEGAVAPPRKKVRLGADGELDGVFDAEAHKESEVPTPRRWEIEGGEEGFEKDDIERYGYDEDVGEEMFYEEDEYGDEDAIGEEDAPGEDEDTQQPYGWS